MEEETEELRERSKRRRTEVSAASGNNHAANNADLLALHRTLDLSALPFSWLDHTLGVSFHHDVDKRKLLRQEIQSLSRQLVQVKRRLNPVAEACAKAANDNKQTNESSSALHATSASQEFYEARSACNPLEILGEGRRNHGLNRRFINRSAIKLANIDAIMGFGLIPQATPSGNPFVFVDLCGAPGGFSEYIVMRCCHFGIRSCYGFGMSLHGTNEHGKGLQWKLSDGVWNEGGTSCSYKVCRGHDGTGDVYSWDNVVCLKEMMKQHGQSEAHLVVADGGFDAQRDSEDQEALSQKLLVCEVAAAMFCLRRGGTMVLKMFGGQTSTIRKMMADMSSCFGSISVTKPISSRPASAERYLVATRFQGLPSSWNSQDWRDSVFLSTEKDIQQRAPNVTLFLDLVDRDMLLLNLKACFSILSYMESKEHATKRNEAFSFRDDNGDYEVPVERYRRAWRL